jgi:hypothetical protein
LARRQRRALADQIGNLNEVTRSGKVRHIGVSNFNSTLLREVVRFSNAPLVTHQFEYHPFLFAVPDKTISWASEAVPVSKDSALGLSHRTRKKLVTSTFEAAARFVPIPSLRETARLRRHAVYESGDYGVIWREVPTPTAPRDIEIFDSGGVKPAEPIHNFLSVARDVGSYAAQAILCRRSKARNLRSAYPQGVTTPRRKVSIW